MQKYFANEYIDNLNYVWFYESLLTGRFGAGFLAGGGASTPSSAISDIYWKAK
jgi:hypothetical protein